MATTATTISGTGVGLVRPVYWGDVTTTDEESFVLPTGTVTLVLADIEGSVRSREADPKAMAASMDRYHPLVAETVAAHGGVLPTSQGEGDSFLAAFSRASDAIAAALALQLMLHDDGWPSPLSVRMALHTGEAEVRAGGDYVGAVVHRCARLRAVAHGGQVLVTRTCAELVADRLPESASLVDLGPKRLRDLTRPEHLFQLAHPALPSAFPLPRTLDAVPNNLPAQLTSFVGRRAELTDITKLVTAHRLVSLCGSGGCGKTRLALHAAADRADEFDDGVWFCDLAPVTEPGLVAATLASVVGVRDNEGSGGSVLETVAGRLAATRTLVVLDNCEHLVAAAAELVDELLRSCPGVHVLATSREPLAVAGERVFRVPSLDLPGSPAHRGNAVEALQASDAVRLFVDRATEARSNFAVTNENAPAVAQICQRLDGIPLAIELAAARVRMLTPEQIAAGLNDRLRLLGAGPRTALPRQQTLRASMDWSHDLLGDDERVVFRRLSAFAGTFDLDAAEAVASGGEIDRYAVLDLLSQLVDRSLVHVEDSGADARYRLLETIRQYASERLVASGEAAFGRTRHAHYYLAATERSLQSCWGPDQAVWARRLALDIDNMRGALSWLESSGDAESLARLVTAVAAVLLYLGYWDEARDWSARAVDACVDVEPRTRLFLLLMSAAAVNTARVAVDAMRLRGDEVPLTELIREATELVEALGVGRAELAATRGWLEDDPARALPLFDEAIALARETGDQRVLADCLLDMATVCYDAGQPDLGVAAAQEGLALRRALGGPLGVNQALSRLARVHAARGDIRMARDMFSEIVDASSLFHSPLHQSRALYDLAFVLLMLGDYDEAVRRLDAARATMRTLGLGWMPATVDARIAYARGDADTAVKLGDSALALASGANRGTVLIGLALARLRSGDLDGARRDVDAGLAIVRSGGLERMVSYGLMRRAEVALAERDFSAADDDAHEALAMMSTTGDRAGIASCLDLLAQVAVGLESPLEAARLFGAAETLREATGLVRPPVEQPVHESAVRTARDSAGDAFTAAWDEGAAMTWEDAVSYARRGRGERKRPASGWSSLTPTELEVARLVAEGLTNPQIGERLFMARSTVKSHLEHIFTKVGVSSRTQLATEVVGRGAEGERR